MKDTLPKIKYGKDGDKWQMTIITPTISKLYTFQSGEELDTISIDGKNVKVSDIDTIHIINTFSVYRRQILTYKDGPRTE